MTIKKTTSFLVLIAAFFIMTFNPGIAESQSATRSKDKSNFHSGNQEEVPAMEYTVSQGDSLWTIAKETGVSVDDIKAENKLQDNDIRPGQILEIPVSVNNPRVAQMDEEQGVGENPEDMATDDQDVIYDDTQIPSDTSKESDENVNEEQENISNEENLPDESVTSSPEPSKQPDVNTETETIQPAPSPAKTNIEKIQQGNKKPPSEDIINLQSEMGLKDLIQTMSEITNQAFVLDDSVRDQKVTIVAPQGGFKKQNALRIFETILDLNGFAIVGKDGVSKVVKKTDIKSESIPTNFGSTKKITSGGYITQIISLENIKAEEVANAIQPLVSREGDVVVYPASNKLIIIDSADNVNRIMDIISDLDVEKKIEFIKIEHAAASEVAEKLLEIFSENSSASGSVTSRTRRTTRARTTRARTTTSNQQQDQGEGVTGQSDILGFKVITNERTNSLIVIAYPQDLAKIKRIINILDVETDQAEHGIYVISINSADAEHIVSVLSGLIGGSGATSTSGSSSSTGGRRINSGGGLSNSGLSNSARSGLSSNSLSSYGGSSLGGGGLAGTSAGGGLSSFGGSFVDNIASSGGGLSTVVAETEGLRITADPATNSVIVVGSRKDYEIIKDVIKKLDVRRKQVYVEAAILEVNLEDLKSFGSNFSFGFTVNGDTLGFGGQQLPGVPSLLGVAADSQSSVNVVNSLSGLFLGVVGEQVDPDGSGPIPPIPSFSAIFQALTSVTDVNVLSTPSILTTDNEQAQIVVADVIPFPTGSTVGTSGVTVQTIERLPVGIRLTIVPQIGEGDFLNLQLATEVSSTRDAPAGLNTAEFGIATTTRSADSTVVVKNGQTIVIGGLVQNRESTLENKTPLLGDIPLVGNLFKFKQKQSQKLNLIILLTPRIVENESDMQEILQEQQKRKMLLREKGYDTLPRQEQ